MNILDENIIHSQSQLLKNWRIRFRQIGVDIGQSGILDENIFSILRQLRLPTFFTRDAGFYNRRLCHRRYRLVYLDVDKSESAIFIRRFLKHSSFDTKAKRVGHVVRVTHQAVLFWYLRTDLEKSIMWE